MTRTALTVGIAWGIAALVVWAWIRAATRPIPATRWLDPEDEVQPWDWYARTMAGGPSGEWREFHD
jgi:hypothetical protein